LSARTTHTDTIDDVWKDAALSGAAASSAPDELEPNLAAMRALGKLDETDATLR